MIEQIEFMAEATRDAAGFVSMGKSCPVVSGHVIHGQKLGRELGIPTANIVIALDAAPSFGIYAVTAFLRGRTLRGIASWGTRPHFDDGAPLLEVHLFDFSGDIYGATLDVRFDMFLRPEARFANIEDFMVQVQADIAAARQFHQS